MGDQTQDNDLYLKLITANVLRLRHQFDLAEAQCSDVLRQEPRNAEAHSVLGDIARDRGNLRDAIEWYRMALELDPGNVSDRKKLEAVIDHVYRGKGGIIGGLREGVTNRLGSAAAEVRTTQVPSPAWITLSTMVGVILVVTIVVVIIGRGGAPTPVSAAEPQSGGFVSTNARALEPQAVRGIPVDAAPTFEHDVDVVEGGLAAALEQEAMAIDPKCAVDHVEIDPRDGAVGFEITMPRVWSADDTRFGIMRVATRLAALAAGWDERISSVLVRCEVTRDGGAATLALVAEADASRFSAISPGGEVEHFERVFSSIWWDPRIERPFESPPSPGVE